MSSLVRVRVRTLWEGGRGPQRLLSHLLLADVDEEAVAVGVVAVVGGELLLGNPRPVEVFVLGAAGGVPTVKDVWFLLNINENLQYFLLFMITLQTFGSVNVQVWSGTFTRKHVCLREIQTVRVFLTQNDRFV